MSQEDLDKHGAKARITVYLGLDDNEEPHYYLDIEGPAELGASDAKLRGLIRMAEAALQQYRQTHLPAAEGEMPEPVNRSVH